MIFIFSTVTIHSSTIHSNIMNLYWNHSTSTSLGTGDGVDEESNKKWHRKEGVWQKRQCPSHKFLYVLFSVTQFSFLPGFSSSPGNITASISQNTSKKVPTSISEITIKYLYKNLRIPPLCQSGLFIQNVSLKIQLLLEMWFFYLLWYEVQNWNFFSLFL